jgi:hypothetical protein
MKTENDKRYNQILPLETLIKSPIIEPNILNLFSSYIASNPDFKYNTTYLTDSIQSFASDIEIFKIKFLIFKEIADKLHKVVKQKCFVNVIFDEIFLCDTKNNSSIEIITDNSNLFRFDTIGRKDCTIKLEYRKIENSNEAIEYIHRIDNIQLNNKEEIESVINNFIKVIERQDHEK